MSKNIFIGSVAINVDGDASAADPIDPNQLADVEYVVSTNFMKNNLRDLLANVAMKVNLTAADGADPDDFTSYVDSANALRQRVDVVKSTQLVAGKFDLNKLQDNGDIGKISATLSPFFGDAQGADPIELLDGSGNTTHSIDIDRVGGDASITVASALPKAIGKQVDLADNDERIFRLMVEPSTMRNLAAFGIREYGGRDRNYQDGDETKSLSKLIESKSVDANQDRSFDQLNDVNSSAAPGTRELAHELLHLLFRDDPPTDANTTLKKDGEPADLKKKWIYDAAEGTLALNYVEHEFRLQFLVVSELDIVKEGEVNPLSCTKASPAARVVAVDGADAPDNPINPKRVLIRYDFNFNGLNEIPGCMDTRARNYFNYANIDDGSCEIEGCTDATADNFAPGDDANVDDGSCLYDGCTNSRATNYNSGANRDDGSCQINGCMDSRADNYDSEATVNIGCVFTSNPGVIYTITQSEQSTLQAPSTVPTQFESNLTDNNVLIFVGDNWGDSISSNLSVYHYKGARVLTSINDLYDMREDPFNLKGYGSTGGVTDERGVWLKLNDVLAGDQIHFDLKEVPGATLTSELRLAIYQKNSSGEFVNIWNRGTENVQTARHIITFDANRDGSHAEKIVVDGNFVDVVVGCPYADSDTYDANWNRADTSLCVWTNSAPKTAIFGLDTYYLESKLAGAPTGMTLSERLTEKFFSPDTSSNAYVHGFHGSGISMWQSKLNYNTGLNTTITAMTVPTSSEKMTTLEQQWAANDGSFEYIAGNFIPIEVMWKGPPLDSITSVIQQLKIVTGVSLQLDISQNPVCGLKNTELSNFGHPIHDNTLCVLGPGVIPVMNRVDNNYAALEGDVLLGLKLKDTYGDGWQEASVTIYSDPDGISQAVVGELFSYGSEANRMVALANGTLYKIVVNGGTLTAETSVDIYNVVDGAFDTAAVDTLNPTDDNNKECVRYFKLVNGVYTHMYISVDGETETPVEGDLPDDNLTGKLAVVRGCTNNAAWNYNSAANLDDGSCSFSSKTVAMIVEEEFTSRFYARYQGSLAYLQGVADIINIPGVYADSITLSIPEDSSLGYAYYTALPNWEYSTTLYFAQRITFKVPDDFDVALSGTRLGNEVQFPDGGNFYTARAVTDIVDVTATGCTDLDATNFDLSAEADDGSCVA